jgi:3-oxoacyl-[acyl-carrier-protein] synthase II
MPTRRPDFSRRVAVTGLGIISPIGNTVTQAWERALAGTPGITRITRFDPARLASQIAGEVKDFDVTPYMAAKEARRMDIFIQYGMAAALQAWREAALEVTPQNAERIGVNFGSGIGGLPLIETMHDELKANGPRRISPFFIPGSIINMTAGLLSIEIGAKGPNLAMVTACTTSTHCIGEAAKSIRYGEADVMIAGGSEATVSELAIGGFAAARALSTRNDDPAGASRPWDKDRDGFVLGEGAGALVLEEYEHAKARGARIYCEVLGYGVSADAHHMTAPPEDGDGGFRAMKNALKDARLEPSSVDYINAHGTSTPLGDVAETIAIKRLLGGHAAKVVVNSTKSMTGHLLGAAGAVEAVFSILALRDQVSPPTINLRTPDPQCDLDYVPNEKRKMPIRIALSNSFGFGGTNGTLIFSGL